MGKVLSTSRRSGRPAEPVVVISGLFKNEIFVVLAPVVPFLVVAASIWWASRGHTETAVLLAEHVSLYAVLIALWEPIVSGLAALATLLMLNPRLSGGRGGYVILIGAAVLAAPVVFLPAALAAFLCAWVVRHVHRTTRRRMALVLALAALLLLLTTAMLTTPWIWLAPIAAAPLAVGASILWRRRGHLCPFSVGLPIALLRVTLTVVAICAALAPVVVRLESSEASWLHYEDVTLHTRAGDLTSSASGAVVSVDDTGMFLLLPDGTVRFIDADSVAGRTVVLHDPDVGNESLATFVARLPLAGRS
jgi:hypothetical protein